MAVLVSKVDAYRDVTACRQRRVAKVLRLSRHHIVQGVAIATQEQADISYCYCSSLEVNTVPSFAVTSWERIELQVTFELTHETLCTFELES